jgi:hypothetical protein
VRFCRDRFSLRLRVSAASTPGLLGSFLWHRPGALPEPVFGWLYRAIRASFSPVKAGFTANQMQLSRRPRPAARLLPTCAVAHTLTVSVQRR